MKVSNNIYNHLSTELVPKKRNTIHKSSELKAVYSSMSKYNKNSPLYLVSLSDKKQEHIIDIKESAITLRDTTLSFSDPESSVYSQKQVHSDHPSVITGDFKRQPGPDLPGYLELTVDALATEQVNIGSYLSTDGETVPPGNYRFSLFTGDSQYRFNLAVSEGDTNYSIQNKFAESVNGRDMGVTATILTEGDSSALMLTSKETGLPESGEALRFRLSDASEDRSFVEAFGLNQVSVPPANAEFSVNGEAHVSTSNHISINQTVELDFHSVSDEPVNISFVPDTGVLRDQLSGFIEAYNNLVTLAEHEGPATIGSRSLSSDISGILKGHREALSAAGIEVSDDGRLYTPEQSGSVHVGELMELFEADSDFVSEISKATERLTLDPMAYINKLIVTYPNKEEKTSATYTQSMYSGMMFNNYA